MGGNAFKHLEVPRLTRSQYDELHAKVSAQLEPLFEAIQTPAPTPEKPTYGDIDFLVHSPQPGVDVEAVKQALVAAEVVVGRPTSNYAVPLAGAFAQVDVHICPKEEHAKQVFLNSYGRLGHILTQALRRHGLYMDVRGLYTIKPTPATPSFLMTSDLSTILQLVHLDEEAYKAGLSTREQVWQWLESGEVNGVPLAHSWGHPSASQKDSVMQEWEERRRSDPAVSIDKKVNRLWALRALGLDGQYETWSEEQEKQRVKAEAEKRTADAITAEIQKRLDAGEVKGKARKAEASRLRKLVEAEYVDVGQVQNPGNVAR